MWQTSDDIELLYKHYSDAPEPMTVDEVANTLLGMKMLNDLRCYALQDTYERKMELNQHCTDPDILAARDKWFDEALIEAKTKRKKK
jgi:hypothetical protein